VYYVPVDEVVAGALRPTDRTSFCEFKGVARYWDVHVGDEVLPGVAWGYPQPSAGYEPLADHVAFYAAPFERCTVGGEQAVPQPGGFYGGWVTSRYVGPFKGVAGSTGW
jgi:uncharacterized protein (DUF427 family)